MGESCFHNFCLGHVHALMLCMVIRTFHSLLHIQFVSMHQDHSTWDELVGHAQIALSR